MSWPNQQEARQRGCTWRWWGRGAILTFEPGCPILEQHWVPGEWAWLFGMGTQ